MLFSEYLTGIPILFSFLRESLSCFPSDSLESEVVTTTSDSNEYLLRL